MSLIVCGNRYTDDGGVTYKSIWCYSDASTVAWSYDTGGHVYAVAQDASGNIYAVGATSGNKNLWKLDSDGNLLDSYNVGDVGGYDQKAVDVDATYVYVGGVRGSYRLPVDLSTQTQIISYYTNSIRVDSSGNIYMGTTGGIPKTLYKYNSALAFQWNEDTNDACYSIKLDSSEDLIVGTGDGEVRKYLADGTSPDVGTWATLALGNASLQIRVDVDTSDDTVYAVAHNNAGAEANRFCYLNSAGTVQWSISTTAGDLERVWIDSSDRVWVVGDALDTYDTWLVDTDEHTFTDVIVLGTDLKDVCGTGFELLNWRKILTEYMPAIEPYFADVKLYDRTASRLLATDSSKVTTSTDLNSWVTGTANQITVTDDTDGTITLSLPQDIHTGASPTFAGEIISNATSANIDFTKTGANAGTFSFYNDGSGHLKGETTGTAGLYMSATTLGLRNTADGPNFLRVVGGTVYIGEQGWGAGVAPGIISITNSDGDADTIINYAKWNGLITANGIVKCDGSGVFSAITDGSANWDTAYSHSQSTSGNPHSVTPTELSLVIGTNTQAFGAVLDDFNTLGVVASDGQFIVGTGAGVFAYESGDTARISLGIGTTDSPTLTGLTVTNCCVLGSNSAVFQPATDSTTFFQVLDTDGGTPIFNVDSTNERVGIGTNAPASLLEVGTGYYTGAYTFKTGSLVFQPFALNNAFVAENAYYNSGWKYINNGYAVGFQMYDGQMCFFTATSGTAGGAMTQRCALKTDSTDAVVLGGNIDLAAGSYAGASVLINNDGILQMGAAPKYSTIEISGVPVIQFFGYSHDNVGLFFDAAYDSPSMSAGWRSGDAGSNFGVYKYNDVLKLVYDSGVGVDSTVTWNDGLVMNTSGAVDVVGNFTAGTIQADDGFTGTGAYTNFTIVGGIITAAS